MGKFWATFYSNAWSHRSQKHFRTVEKSRIGISANKYEWLKQSITSRYVRREIKYGNNSFYCSQLHSAMSIWFLIGQHWLLFVYFQPFYHYRYSFTTNESEKCPSTIQRWDSNSQPSDYEFPPLTTRPGLPALHCQCFFWQ